MENYLLDAIGRLAKAGVDFVICGGVACILQGSDRNSIDLDINTSMDEANLKKIITLAKKMNWKPRIPEPIEHLLDPGIRRQWIEDKNALVYTLDSQNGLLQIDIFLDYPIIFEELKKDADEFEIDGSRVKVSSAVHLLQAKKLIKDKRRQDIYDIEVLTEIIHGRQK